MSRIPSPRPALVAVVLATLLAFVVIATDGVGAGEAAPALPHPNLDLES
jgi:hypothetical protein